MEVIETDSLILDKAKFSDWEEMYHNVWSQPECAKYMAWKITESEEAAKIRMMKTIEFQKIHDTYLVYEKAGGKPIGFAGAEKLSSYVYQETGICLGPNYMRKGFGKQIVQGLIEYCRKNFGAKEFIYSTREANEVSNSLAKSLGFTVTSEEDKIDCRSGQHYTLLRYSLKLDQSDKESDKC